MDEYRVVPTVPTDYPLIVSAVELSIRHGISYYDGAILAAAEALEASALYTEDSNHGQSYGAVRAVNPFVEGWGDAQTVRRNGRTRAPSGRGSPARSRANRGARIKS